MIPSWIIWITIMVFALVIGKCLGINDGTGNETGYIGGFLGIGAFILGVIIVGSMSCINCYTS